MQTFVAFAPYPCPLYPTPMLILGLETTCDETSAAVVRDGRQVLSNVVASQIDLHAKFGGVVPEVAARAHLESLNLIVGRIKALAQVHLMV